MMADRRTGGTAHGLRQTIETNRTALSAEEQRQGGADRVVPAPPLSASTPKDYLAGCAASRRFFVATKNIRFWPTRLFRHRQAGRKYFLSRRNYCAHRGRLGAKLHDAVDRVLRAARWRFRDRECGRSLPVAEAQRNAP